MDSCLKRGHVAFWISAHLKLFRKTHAHSLFSQGRCITSKQMGHFSGFPNTASGREALYKQSSTVRPQLLPLTQVLWSTPIPGHGGLSIQVGFDELGPEVSHKGHVTLFGHRLHHGIFSKH
ncbi:hypothetical protein NPIL_681741 [Nephila pilipes]|uniref:Uncharacterized protein n=1 Tax=Nephila pilipes TaxID=299642 RepID=A0A8X6PY76_NEPPI|nr:hypothetical protein NPIL_681741 [Nephila pilipes]